MRDSMVLKASTVDKGSQERRVTRRIRIDTKGERMRSVQQLA